MQATASVARRSLHPRTLLTLNVRCMSTGADMVPLISLKPFLDGEKGGKEAVAAAIGHAAANSGFLAIKDHGFPQDTMDNAWAATRSFFDLSAEEKDSYEAEDQEKYPYGYSGFGAEVLSAGRSLELGVEDAMMPDLKECFAIGPYNPASGSPPVQWPTNPADFKPSWEAYYREMERLSTDMLTLFAVALELPDDFFADKIDRHRSAMRALNYPELSEEPAPGQLRASAHTDYGTLTILKPDDAPGGLQVLGKDDKWHDVPYVPDAFVINLGDLMARWTNDKWVSTKHRVVTPPSNPGKPTRRQSIAFFHNINADQVVECIETCHGEDDPIKYEPIVAFDFLMQKHLASMGQ